MRLEEAFFNLKLILLMALIHSQSLQTTRCHLVWNNFKDGIVWRIGNGRTVDFFRDTWISKLEKLQDFVIPRSFPLTATKVVDFVNDDGNWD